MASSAGVGVGVGVGIDIRVCNGVVRPPQMHARLCIQLYVCVCVCVCARIRVAGPVLKQMADASALYPQKICSHLKKSY
jgi:hypothetical protein